MLRYIINRILWMIPVLLGVLLIVFALSAVAPGDPVDAILGPDAPIEDRIAKREELGLNDPFIVRYVRYVKDLVTKGDFGTSYQTGRPVLSELITRFPNTLKLTFWAVLVALIIGIPLGTIAAIKQYSAVDNASMVFALFGVSVPQFWFALMLILIFSIKLQWVPSIVMGNSIAEWILPVAMVGIGNVGMIARTTRSSMLEVIRQDYIRTARAKGQTETKVIFGHALRNSLIPVAATLGNTMAASLGGSIIAESIFSVNGVGLYMLNSINASNWPSVEGGLLFLAIVFSLVMLFIDLLYAVIDPRLKDEFEAKSKMAANRRRIKKEARQAKQAAGQGV